jgi:hypothetical protein
VRPPSFSAFRTTSDPTRDANSADVVDLGAADRLRGR